MSDERLAIRPGYEPLAQILDDALEQAQTGKGHERHAEDGQPWLEQPVFDIPRALEEFGPGVSAGQFAKKMHEAWRLPHPARRREILGAINSLAALVRLADEEADRDRACGSE
ncbi:MAG: hypothetical protein ACRDKE_07730 [Solirubrobacterales bacterium]